MRARGPGESAKLLLDVVDVLAARSIDYAVIGALAASLHGAGRASLDADLVVSASVMEGTRIDEALKRAGLTTELRRGDLVGAEREGLLALEMEREQENRTWGLYTLAGLAQVALVACAELRQSLRSGRAGAACRP